MTLLENINAVIKENGGRIRLARVIIEESPAWFDLGYRITVRRSAKHKDYQEAYRGSNPARFWETADTDFLVDNYGSMPTRLIALKLSRTVGAVKRRIHWLRKQKI